MLKFNLFLHVSNLFHYYFFTLLEVCLRIVDSNLSFVDISFSFLPFFPSYFASSFVSCFSQARRLIRPLSILFSSDLSREQKRHLRQSSSIFDVLCCCDRVSRFDFPCPVPTTILARMMTTNYNWMRWCAGNVLPRESPQVLKAVGL